MALIIDRPDEFPAPWQVNQPKNRVGQILQPRVVDALGYTVCTLPARQHNLELAQLLSFAPELADLAKRIKNELVCFCRGLKEEAQPCIVCRAGALIEAATVRQAVRS